MIGPLGANYIITFLLATPLLQSLVFAIILYMVRISYNREKAGEVRFKGCLANGLASIYVYLGHDFIWKKDKFKSKFIN